MGTRRDIAVFVGSLRKESLNRKAAHALAELAPDSLALEIVEIGGLTLFNDDDEGPDAPSSWVQLRDRVRRADGVLFVSPEYNRSVPGVLKNAIDIASRPYGKNTWDGKPGGVVTVSPGAIGGFGANHHLRQTLVFVNVLPLQQPEAYIGNAGKLFDDAGRLASDSTRDFLGKYMQAYAAWVEKVLAGKAGA